MLFGDLLQYLAVDVSIADGSVTGSHCNSFSNSDFELTTRRVNSVEVDGGFTNCLGAILGCTMRKSSGKS